MPICLHPSAANPVRYRVYERSLGIRVDFSFAELGRSGAEQAAKQYESNVVLPKLKIANLIEQLPTNQIFDEKGRINGLERKVRELSSGKKVASLVFRKRVNGVDERAVVSLAKRTFEEGYKIMQAKILTFYSVERSVEIARLFRSAKRYYW